MDLWCFSLAVTLHVGVGIWEGAPESKSQVPGVSSVPEKNNLSFIETSALDSTNVEEAFKNILTGGHSGWRWGPGPLTDTVQGATETRAGSRLVPHGTSGLQGLRHRGGEGGTRDNDTTPAPPHSFPLLLSLQKSTASCHRSR